MRFKKMVTVGLVLAMSVSLMACGGVSKTTTKENDTNTESEKDGGTYTFFYTEDLSQKEMDEMLDKLNKRLVALEQDKYVELKGDVESKKINVTYTKDADTDLFVSVFCVNNFEIQTSDGETIVDSDGIEKVETYYMKNKDENGKETDTTTGFLHFFFNDKGEEAMKKATANATDGNTAIVFCLNGDKVNETSVMEVISTEMYASGFGNLLELFKVCIEDGPLPVSLYSETALYDGQEAVTVTSDGEEIDLNNIQPDGYIKSENTETDATEENESIPEDAIDVADE